MMENFNLKCEQLKTYICDGVNQVGCRRMQWN